MSTGYTEVLFNRDNVTFSEFAQRCARAFGPLVHMREDQLDAPLREAPEDCAYYAQQVKDAQDNFDRLRAMSEEDAVAEYEADYAHISTLLNNATAQNAAKIATVEAMLVSAMEWIPPSDDHNALKEFMLEQLRVELSYLQPMGPPPRRNVKSWYLDRMASATKRLASARENYDAARKRVQEANKWIAELKASL